MVSHIISSITGSLEGVGPGWADVSVGGITLRVNVPLSAVEQLGATGARVRLFTSLQVREDGLALFGFFTVEARQAFQALMGISGVGPRVALSVLSRFTPDSLAAAVNSGDADAFSGVPWVGKKTASRIVLELKGKLEVDLAAATSAGADGDVVQALVALGYTPAEARQAASALPAGRGTPLEDRVRLALQRMASV